MRATFFHFLIFTVYQAYLAFGLNCKDISKESQCNQLTGCLWDQEACTGSISSTAGCDLTTTTCLYVDVTSTNSTADGKIQSPYKDFITGVREIIKLGGSLIIINTQNDTTMVVSPATIVATKVILIKPLFKDSKYYIVPSTSSRLGGYFLQRLTKVTIIGAIIRGFIKDNYSYFFSLAPAGGELVFKDVDLDQMTLPMALDSAANSIFSYYRGRISNSTVQFPFMISTFQDIQVIDCNAFEIKRNGYGKVDGINIINMHLSGGELTSIFETRGNLNLVIKDSVFEKTAFQFGDFAQIKSLNLSNVTFRDIRTVRTVQTVLGTTILVESFSVSCFICLKSQPASGTHSYIIQNTTFQNIFSRGSLILVDDNIRISLIQVIMNNITTDRVPMIAAEFVRFGLAPRGICGTAISAGFIIEESNFTNIQYSCFGLEESALQLKSSIFNNSALEIYSKPTPGLQDKLDDTDGILWIKIKGTVDPSEPDEYSILIQNNKFIENKNCSKYGGAIRATGMSQSKIYLIANQFIGNIALFGGAVYIDNPLVAIDTSNNIFENNYALHGGAMYKESISSKDKQFVPSVKMEGDKYVNNSALKNGGALFLNWESLAMSNSEFIKSKAENGAGIYFLNLDKYYNQNLGYLRSSKFVQNVASNAGSAMKTFFRYSKLNEDPSYPCTFVDNIDFKNENISPGKPSYYVLSFYDVIVEKEIDYSKLLDWTLNPKLTTLAYSINTSDTAIISNQIKQKSGNELTQIMKIDLMDDENQLADYITDEKIDIQITRSESNFTAFVAGNIVSLSFERGHILIKDALIMTGMPDSSATLNFKINQVSANMLMGLSLPNFDIQVDFIHCEIGDSYSNYTKTCTPCTSGTFSFDDPYSSTNCYRCLQNAKCPRGSKIAPSPGFWRYSSSTTTILKCPESSACLGGLIDERYYAQGVCMFPYKGNLCDSCTENYAKFGASTSCVNCSEDAIYYIKLVGFIIIQVIVIVYILRCLINAKFSRMLKLEDSNSKNLNGEGLRMNLAKIIINFVQISSLILQYRISWPDYMDYFIAVTNKIIPTSKDGFGISCFISLVAKNNENINFIKFLLTQTQPFVLFILTFYIHKLYNFVRKAKNKNNSIIALCTIIIFIIQPHLTQLALELFRCQNYTNDNNSPSFMTDNPRVECWTSLHFSWSFGLGLPLILFWGLIIPLFAFLKVKGAHKGSLAGKNSKRYSFLSGGFLDEFYYWEFIILIKRTLIILILTFLKVDPAFDQAFATFLIIVAFIFVHLKIRPYIDQELNTLEIFSSITLSLMSITGVSLSSANSTSDVSRPLAVISIGFNAAFYLLVVFYFIQSYKKQYIIQSFTPNIQITSIQGNEDNPIRQLKTTEFPDERKTINVKSQEDEQSDESMVPSEIEPSHTKGIESPDAFTVIKHSQYLALRSSPSSPLSSPNSSFRVIPFPAENVMSPITLVSDSSRIKKGTEA